jgi:YbbR domain-containing protein
MARTTGKSIMQRLLSSGLIGNFIWVIVSIILAIGVWYIAVTSSDPITQRQFPSISVQLIQDDTTVLTNTPTRFARVTIQAAQTIVSSRRADDVIIRADLTGLGPGTHTVPLDVTVALPQSEEQQRIIAQTQPSQITVELEQRESFQKPIEIVISDPPPVGFTSDEPVVEIFQVVVSGASQVVSEVVAVRGLVDLSNNQNPIEVDTRLFAVDADGNRVDDVTIEPQTASVSVNITRRDDVKQVSVRPNILVGTQPDGYTLSTFTYTPQTIFIGGTSEQLLDVNDTIFTIPINLQDRTTDFEVVVPVRLPDENLFVIGGNNDITVNIGILPQIAVRQFDNITVEHLGLTEGYRAIIAPQSVSAIINGASVLVENLEASEIQVLVDLNGLEPGRYDLTPSVAISQPDLNEDNVSLLPAVVNVEIVSIEPDTEITEEPIPFSTPIDE